MNSGYGDSGAGGSDGWFDPGSRDDGRVAGPSDEEQYIYIRRIYFPHTRSHHGGCIRPICIASGWVGSALL
jgi:hypothetical protein